MTGHLKEKLKASKRRLATKLQKYSAEDPEKRAEESKTELEKPLSVAYQMMGEKSGLFIPLFKDLDRTLQHSGLRINFKAYVSLTVLSSVLITASVAVVVPVVLVVISHIALASALVFGFGGALFAWAFTVIGFYLYPVYCADNHKLHLGLHGYSGERGSYS